MAEISQEPEPTTDPKPEEFVDLVARAEPGWSDRFGGPAGVVALTERLQDQLESTSAHIADVRVAALRELLSTRTGSEVAAITGVPRLALHALRRKPPQEETTW